MSTVGATVEFTACAAWRGDLDAERQGQNLRLRGPPGGEDDSDLGGAEVGGH